MLIQAFVLALIIDSTLFNTIALKYAVDPVVLEGICRYESGNGRKKYHRNKNGSWDVGFCQNHRRKRKRRPRIPTDKASITEAARELRYWKKQHNKFCNVLYSKTKRCGSILYGKWRGVKNCWRPHPWWAHYNWGFRILRNNYDKKVQCFINNKFQKCKKTQWRMITFPKKNSS